MRRFMLLFVMATSCWAQQAKPWYKSCTFWSTMSLVGANVADASSSWRQVELNPALASPGGKFGVRSATLKFSLVGGYMAVQSFFIKRSPESRRAWCAASYGGAALVGGVAARNYSLR